MKKLFTFDVTLKELMDLRSVAKEFHRLSAVFSLLKLFWYNLSDKKDQIRRWNRIRVGSVQVFLDDDNLLHLDFFTRFNLSAYKPFLDALDLISVSEDDSNFPDELKDFDVQE
jgi:hypothetical protein